MNNAPQRDARARCLTVLTAGCALVLPLTAVAHFQELIPSAEIVATGDDTTVHLDLRFTRPTARGAVMASSPRWRWNGATRAASQCRQMPS